MSVPPRHMTEGSNSPDLVELYRLIAACLSDNEGVNKVTEHLEANSWVVNGTLNKNIELEEFDKTIREQLSYIDRSEIEQKITPIQFAIICNQAKLALILIEKATTVDSTYEQSALELAAERGMSDVMIAILQKANTDISKLNIMKALDNYIEELFETDDAPFNIALIQPLLKAAPANLKNELIEKILNYAIEPPDDEEDEEDEEEQQNKNMGNRLDILLETIKNTQAPGKNLSEILDFCIERRKILNIESSEKIKLNKIILNINLQLLEQRLKNIKQELENKQLLIIWLQDFQSNATAQDVEKALILATPKMFIDSFPNVLANRYVAIIDEVKKFTNNDAEIEALIIENEKKIQRLKDSTVATIAEKWSREKADLDKTHVIFKNLLSSEKITFILSEIKSRLKLTSDQISDENIIKAFFAAFFSDDQVLGAIPECLECKILTTPMFNPVLLQTRKPNPKTQNFPFDFSAAVNYGRTQIKLIRDRGTSREVIVMHPFLKEALLPKPIKFISKEDPAYAVITTAITDRIAKVLENLEIGDDQQIQIKKPDEPPLKKQKL